MAGNLLTDYFLTDGIKTTPEWLTSLEEEAQLDTSGRFYPFQTGNNSQRQRRFAIVVHHLDSNWVCASRISLTRTHVAEVSL